VGTGAFSSVEADRTVTLESAGDGSALLKIEPGDGNSASEIATSTTETGDNVSQLQLNQTDLNGDAVTTFNQAIKITNTGGEKLGLYIEDGGSDDGLGDTEELDLRTGPGGGDQTIVGSSNAVDLSAQSDSNNSIQLDVEIDLTGDKQASDTPNQITIVAENGAHSDNSS
jgi:hypothetical protein